MDDEAAREIAFLKERNRRVELDKAWEVSWARRLCIAVVTYAAAAAWLALVSAERPLLTAAVPAGAYVLSTVTLPVVKRWWVAGR
jgi:hypothetical protein